MNNSIIQSRWRIKMIRKKGSNKLYLDLFYLDEYYIKTTGLDDTHENRELLRPELELINDELATGTFQFARAFPQASEADKCRFSLKEGRTYIPSPDNFTFRQGYELWLADRFKHITSKSTRDDYMKAITPHILPYFGNMTFNQISYEELCCFFSTRYKYGEEVNGLVSEKRMKNICIPLNAIYEFTVKRMRWDLESPFAGISEYINEITAKHCIELATCSLTNDELRQRMKEHEHAMSQGGTRDVVLFSDYLKVLSKVEDYYRPGIELITLTGIIASELAAIRTDVINDDELPLRWSLRDGDLKDYLKTGPRSRVMPMTKAIRRCLDLALKQKQDDSIFIFRRKSGIELNDRCLRDALERACDAAGVKRFIPYALRHSFVAYCEIMGILESRIIGLMGHADKSMIDKIYGKYVDKLEKDADAIKAYFGEDFWGE